ncbi:MAG TPA: hypothetical protein ENJ95_12290 [Bacteroidetes bacterium]|nr:hypothetical protein [Bacteroidota bacterium]
MGTIKLTWWNLQNLFDTDDDPISLDFNYTPAHGWTNEIYAKKKQQLASLINMTHNGEGPDILAVCEIEKDAILAELLTDMGRADMEVAVDVSGTSDLRGIDVALAYNKNKLELLEVESHMVHLRYRTRDIYTAKFKIIGTEEEFTVIGCHLPSRSRGRYQSEPNRIAVAENISFIVEEIVKYTPQEYIGLKAADDLEAVIKRWDSNVIIVGDFNDEPTDRSILEHLKATGDMDRVTGKTNDIDGFKKEVGRYRQQDVYLYNATWKFISVDQKGTYFIDSVPATGTRFSNRYQILDQLIVSRGVLSDTGFRINLDSVDIFIDKSVNATRSGRPKKFNKKNGKGYSDHFPVTAVFEYDE